MTPGIVHTTKQSIRSNARDLPKHYEPMINHLEEVIDTAYEELIDQVKKRHAA